MSDFDCHVCFDCYRSTNSKVWNDAVFDWFYRMDFIPCNWKDVYLEFVKNL